MRAREPESEGFVEHDGVKIHYEVYGDGGPTILLMPSWTIVHKETWKLQIPYLARHHRVVVYDGPGNGGSDRTLRPEAYHHTTQVEYALRVLDATGTDRPSSAVCPWRPVGSWNSPPSMRTGSSASSPSPARCRSPTPTPTPT